MYGGNIMSITNKKAFTLIELLVVVLIIGILAAIALPQYRKTVRKAKTAQVFIILDRVYKALNEYYLINGDTAGASWKTIDPEINLTGCSIAKASWTVPDGLLACTDNPHIKGGRYAISEQPPTDGIIYMENPNGSSDSSLDYLLGLNYKTGRRWCSTSSAEDICLLLGGVRQSNFTLCGTHRGKCYAL
jgi:prepilin-type N-terminal cleavage/methylation domain-containing protein